MRKDRCAGTRFIQMGESAGKTISLPAATCRSFRARASGQRFGRRALDQSSQLLAGILQVAAQKSLPIQYKGVPIAEVD